MADSLTITLTPELSARVRAYMDGANHPSAESVVEAAISALEQELSPMEEWELEEIRQACEEAEQNPVTYTSEQVKQRLEASAARLRAEELLAKAG